MAVGSPVFQKIITSIFSFGAATTLGSIDEPDLFALEYRPSNARIFWAGGTT
jgi:hypothetical protein